MCIPGYLTVSQLEQSILFICHEHKLICGMRICTNVGFCKVSPECWLCKDFRILLLLSDIVIKWSELISSNSVKMQLELEIFLIITICQIFSWPGRIICSVPNDSGGYIAYAIGCFSAWIRGQPVHEYQCLTVRFVVPISAAAFVYWICQSPARSPPLDFI